jgi:hypothetical protein
MAWISDQHGSSHSLFPSITAEFDRITEENLENPVSVSGTVADILIEFLPKKA